MSWNQGWSQQGQGGNSWSQQGQGANSWQQGSQQQSSGNASWGQQQQQQQQQPQASNWQSQATQQAGQQQWGAQQQQQQQPQQQQTQQAKASTGTPKNLTVQGCQHPTIGGIVRGAFSAISENHTKPVYKKDQQVSGLDVMIYYWDERDGPSQAGWWFGPKVGGEQVWAYHPETSTAGPPKQGWQVPYGGPVDASFVVDVVQEQQPQQSWGNQQQAQQPQQSQQSQQGWGNQQQSWGQQSQQQSQEQSQQSWGNNQQSQGNQQSLGNQQAQGNAQGNQQSWGNQQSQGNQQGKGAQQGKGGQQSQGNQQAKGGQQSWGNQQSQSWGEESAKSEDKSWDKQQSWGNQQGQDKQQSWGNQGNQQAQGWNAKGNQQSWGQGESQGEQSWGNQQASWGGQQSAMQAAKEKAEAAKAAQAEQFKKQQEMVMAKKKEQEELQKKKVEEQQRKMAEWKKKIEEDKAKKLEEDNRKKEELRIKKEAEEKKRLEQRATFAIKRVIQRIRTATPETFDTLEGELHAEVEKELPNCGDHADAMKDEVEKGLEQGRMRVEQIKEQRRKEEEKKAKEEAEKKEKEEKAKALVEELDGLMSTAEEQVKSLQETIKTSDIESSANSPEQVRKVSKITDEAEEAGRAGIKTCFEFMKANGAEIKAPEADAETKAALSKLLARMNEVQKNMEAASGQAKAAKAKAEKKAAAQVKTKEIEDTFKKYDKDKDGELNEKEVLAYAKGECGITLDKELVSFAMMSLVEADSKGIKVAALPRLRSIIGIKRELARDQKRIEFRLEKERVIGGMKDALKAKVKDAAKFVTEANKAVKQAESEVALIAKRAKVMKPEEMISLAAKSDKVHDAAKSKYEKAPSALEKAMASIDPKYEKDLKASIHKDARKLDLDLKRMEMRLNRVSVKCRRYRDQAFQKEIADILSLRSKAAKVIQYNQSLKKLSYDDLFALFDNGSGSVSESKFLAFFDTADKEIRHLTMGEAKEEEKKEDEAAATTGDEEKPKEDGEEKADGEEAEKKEEKEEEKTEVKDESLIETVEISQEELKRVFKNLSDQATSLVSKEDFFPFVKKYMKVVQATAMTNEAEIGSGKPARKLEAGEVVEVIEGPIKDLATKVSRIRCKALKDDLEGWLSIAGNQGTVFLEEKAHGLYKVLKKTVVTDSFEMNGEDNSDESKIVKMGSIVEVREEAKKDEASGLTRMKGRVRSQDHLVGWMTTIDKEGKVFARPY